MSEEKDDLKQTEELFQFLQGNIPEGYRIAKKNVPKLTPDQAWTAIWYLQNLYWQPPDHFERCDVCQNIYNSWSEGGCLDYGRAPYHFCGNCIDGPVYAKKARSRLNPDKEMRREYLTP